eukprot:535501-Hanusia_phi.AAC.1
MVRVVERGMLVPPADAGDEEVACRDLLLRLFSVTPGLIVCPKIVEKFSLWRGVGCSSSNYEPSCERRRVRRMEQNGRERSKRAGGGAGRGTNADCFLSRSLPVFSTSSTSETARASLSPEGTRQLSSRS